MEKVYTLSKEQFQHNKNMWKQYHERRVSGHMWHHLLWILVTNRDVFKAFPPLHTERKLKQHSDKYWKLNQALVHLRFVMDNIKKVQEKPESNWSKLPTDKIVLSHTVENPEWSLETEGSAGEKKIQTVQRWIRHDDIFFYITPEFVVEILEKVEETLTVLNSMVS